jgi:repressor LexA
MSNDKPLSRRQDKILKYILKYFGEHSRPPTIREIGAAVNISSTSVVNYNLTRLAEKGLLAREAEVSRGLRLTEKALRSYGAVAETVSGLAMAVMEGVNQMVRIPLKGQIVASKPIEVFDDAYDADDAVELSAAMLPSNMDELFALRVKGESMIDAMVNDGDIVVMRRQETANNGDMVAVWLSNETTTLKRFYHEGSQIRLQPANPTMDPIYVHPRDVQVQGKVVMVLRQTA